MPNQNNPHPQDRPNSQPNPQTGQQRGTGPRKSGTQTR